SCGWHASEKMGHLESLIEDALLDANSMDSTLLDDVLVGRPERLWGLRHALSEGLARAGRVIAFDLSFRRDVVLDFRRAAISLVAEKFPGLRVADFGHIADGGIHFNVVAPPGLNFDRD